MNSVQISGNVARDPDLRITKNGTAGCRFSVACNDDYIDNNGEKKERTNYPSVTVWGKLAEMCGDKIVKGSRVFVSGRITTGSYEKDGQKHYTTDITADFVSLSITNKDSNQTATLGKGASNFDNMGTPVQEEIPF